MTKMSNPVYFNKLYNLVCDYPISQPHLRVLKEQFISEIKSVRRLDAIISVRDLLVLLKKRACIDCQNYLTLEHIALSLNIPLPLENNAPIIGNGPVEVLAQERARPRQEPLQNNSFVRHVNQDILAAPRLTAKERVYEIIAKEIGQKWKNFARSLGIHEGQLDSLEVKYSNISDRVYRILYYFEENCDQRQWRSHLLDALVDARRRDLKQRANCIFDTHM